ncbi:MAG: ATPase, T2SS/T4P/T4SS family [Chthoniobacteraceae bacterium]
MIALAAVPAFASEVRLKSGQFYKDVAILARDKNSIQIQLPYGTATFPLSEVATIDGVAANPTPVPTPKSTPISTPIPTPTATETPIIPSLPTEASTPLPASTPAPSIAPSQRDPWPEYKPSLNFDLLLLAFAVVAGIWFASVAYMQRDLYHRRKDPRLWTNLAILLPGISFGLYSISRTLDKMKTKRAAQRNTNEVVANRERSREKFGARARRGFEFLDEERQAVQIRNPDEASGLETAQEVLEEALLERASDVHIEPTGLGYGVRFRIDGVMHARMKFEQVPGKRLVTALKALAQIDVAEKRKAQDGRFRVRAGDSDVDFRVATATSIFGEKLVIRILDHHQGLLSLRELGMPQAMLEEFERVIHSRNGMILATGPTGSGKTSTLYSAISQLDAQKLNIMTIEDPVEYELQGATQIPVNPKAGVTYESGLRSLLRQDPDVIFVGEMRDVEAAQIALRAALTGHLVFSSLHTRDAIGTIIRLEEMGIERHLIASSLLVMIAQRLVRVLCPDCREGRPCTGEELYDINLALPAGETIYHPKGCEKCNGTGYLGRTGIFEMVVFDDSLRQVVTNGIDESEITEIARSLGYRSFREDGAEKILLGITSVEEVLQSS